MNENIQQNMVVRWENGQDKGRLLRILWVDREQKISFVFPLSGKKGFPIPMEVAEISEALEDKVAVIRTVDPYGLPVLDEESLPPRNRAIRDKAWNAIKELAGDVPAIFIFQTRSKLVKNAAAQAKVGQKYIYKWLRMYWQGGMTMNALLPGYSKCGNKGEKKGCGEKKRGRPNKLSVAYEESIGINIGLSDFVIIETAVDKYYVTKEKNPVKRAYKLMLQNYYNRGYEMRNGVLTPIMPPPDIVPSYRQFHYYLHKLIHPEQSSRARIGDRAFNLQRRAVLGNSALDAYGPGHFFQIDSTIADIYLVCELLPHIIIGRPVLYFIVDVFSRMVVGFYVGLEGPNWTGASMALACAASDKVAVCKKYGVTILPEEWPSSSLPQQLIADRAELIGHHSDLLVKNFNITLTNTPPYRADFKAVVEQEFNRANKSVIHWMPGAVRERFRERGEKDHRLDAIFTLSKFSEIILRLILLHNKTRFIDDYPLAPEMIAAGVNPIPCELWNWGVRNRSGHLQHHLPAKIIQGLMPRGEASVRKDGIYFRKVYYSCPRAVREGWFVDARMNGTKKIEVAYDPRRMDRIYLLRDMDGPPIECFSLPKSATYAEKFYEEILEYDFARANSKFANSHLQMQGEADFSASVKAIMDSATQKADAALALAGPISKTGRVSSIRPNRQAERIRLGHEEAFRLSSEEPSEPEANNYESVEANDEIAITEQRNRSRLDALKHQRDGR